ncbi:hypothetical protein ONZ45_g1943 [Pleurotus djamor]|nr:hypothetical protein ONZ45_g1943 [Pleurotus djamor]
MYKSVSLNLARRCTAVAAGSPGMASSRCTSTRFYSSTMHDNDPELLEAEKQKNLRGLQHKTSTPHSHAPGWNEHLASASEASVKADRSDGTPADLQRSTIEYIHSRHSPDERAAPTNAFYSHDTVKGPLSGAQGVEEVKEQHTVHDETTTVLKERIVPTDSEANVKADRGEV